MQMTPARGRPKVRSDEESRAIIVACAFELFIDQGYDATSTNEIAARCQMSKRTFYRLFASKTDLFAATVAHHRQLMMQFPPHDPARSLEDQLATIFRVDIGPEDDRRRKAFLEMSIREIRSHPELLDLITEIGGDASRRDLADWLDEGRALGLVSIGEPLATARILMDLLFGAAALKTGHGAEWPDGDDRPRFMRDCIRLIVGGIGAARRAEIEAAAG